MFFNNGKKVGGYSLESYEPTDVRPDENNKANEFIKSTFEKKIMPQPNFNLNITTLNNNFQNYNINNNSVSLVPMPQSMVPYLNKVDVSSNPFIINKINKTSNIPTVNNLKISPIAPQYSNMTKIVYPQKTVLNLANRYNYNAPKMNYPNINIPQHKRSKTITTVISTRPTPIINKYQFNISPITVPLANPQKTIFNNYGSITKNILPLYPTITYRKMKIF